MSKKPMLGLRRRGGTWHIDKRVKGLPGGRLRESTGTCDLEQAEQYLVHRLEQIRNASVYGVRFMRRSSELLPGTCSRTHTRRAFWTTQGISIS